MDHFDPATACGYSHVILWWFMSRLQCSGVSTTDCNIYFRMAASDKILGSLMVLVAAVVFIYYTTWALLLPFVPTSSSLHNLFPAREWAIRIPVFLLLAGGGAVALFVGSVLVKEARKKSARAGKVA